MPVTCTNPRVGDVQVNATDYDGEIVVEQLGYWNGELCWAVPAWDERGYGDLEGPFASVAQAEAAVREAFQ